MPTTAPTWLVVGHSLGVHGRCSVHGAGGLVVGLHGRLVGPLQGGPLLDRDAAVETRALLCNQRFVPHYAPCTTTYPGGTPYIKGPGIAAPGQYQYPGGVCMGA